MTTAGTGFAKVGAGPGGRKANGGLRRSVSAQLGSMRFQVFLISFLGLFAAAAVSLSTAMRSGQQEQLAFRATEMGDIVRNFDTAYASASPATRRQLLRDGQPRFRPPRNPPSRLDPAPYEEASIRRRIPGRIESVRATGLRACYFKMETFPPRARPSGCWIVGLRLVDGAVVRFALAERSNDADLWRAFGRSYLVALLFSGTLLALVISHMATKPLRTLAKAAAATEPDLAGEPLPLVGPAEVRDTTIAFNMMRDRVRRHMRDRTHMLASISHDLQTPLTRLRLRVDQVTDPQLRFRMLADLNAMKELVREGLELAQSAETSEPYAVLDLDSLLQSLAQDATDGERSVVFAHPTKTYVRVRPRCLRRCLLNLIENALKFGGSVEIGVRIEPQGSVITIRDRGPGIPEDLLADVMEPFKRLENSRSRRTGGVGLGLTIAQILAEKCGATVRLANHPDGGLVASVQHFAVVPDVKRKSVA